MKELTVALKEAADALELYGYKDNVDTITSITTLASAILIADAMNGNTSVLAGVLHSMRQTSEERVTGAEPRTLKYVDNVEV